MSKKQKLTWAIKKYAPDLVQQFKHVDYKNGFIVEGKKETRFRRFIIRNFPEISEEKMLKIEGHINDNEIKLVKGNEIIDYYADCCGQESCMTQPERLDFLKLYALNPNVVSLAVFNVGSYEARALLWQSDVPVLDKVYANDQIGVYAFDKYCKSNNFDCVIGIGDTHNRLKSRRTRYVALDYFSCGIPYFDTFSFCKFADNKMLLTNRIHKDFHLILRTCRGTYYTATICSYCGAYTRSDEPIPLCDNCIGKFTYCYVCGCRIKKTKSLLIGNSYVCKKCQ